MVLMVAMVAVATIVYGFGDAIGEEEHNGHHPLVHALLAGICGAFLTGDIFNMYVWFEVMLIASFGLLVIGGGRDELDGAVKYAGLNLIATVAFLSGVGLLYGATGALNMADLHARLAGREGETAILAAAAFLIFAFASKAALFPLFFWLPASYHTPSFTTSAVFAALLTKVGVYALIRVFTLVFQIDGTPIQTLLAAGAVLSMGAGALGALVMPEVRRVLGFSIIASVGTMLLGLAVGDAARHRRGAVLPVPGRGGEGGAVHGRRRGAAADRLGALRPHRRALAGAARAVAAVAGAGAVARRRAAVRRLLGEAPAGARDDRGRALGADAGGARRRAADALRHGAALGGGLLEGRIPTARPPSPAGCPPPCWRRSSS